MIDLCVDSIESPPTTGKPIPDLVKHANALIAYKFGNDWPTYGPYAQARPDLERRGWIISTTLTWDGCARMYDIEEGGGRIVNIGRFMAQAERRWGKPILYTFASQVQAMIAGAADQGHGRDDYFVISAHPNGVRHICGPNAYGRGRPCGYPQADGTQYAFHRPGNCDVSLLEDYVLPAAKPKPPTHQRGEGTAVAEIHVDLDTFAWDIVSKPGSKDLRWEPGMPRYAAVEVQLGLGGPVAGRWRHRPLPFDAPPLGDP